MNQAKYMPTEVSPEVFDALAAKQKRESERLREYAENVARAVEYVESELMFAFPKKDRHHLYTLIEAALKGAGIAGRAAIKAARGE